jgi:anaerobic selenocysteine-containing dehydrogenase
MHDFDRRDFLRGSTIAAAASTFGLLGVPAAKSSSAAGFPMMNRSCLVEINHDRCG